MKKWIIGFLLLLILAGTVWPIGRRTYFGCIDCGMRRKDLTLFGTKFSTDTRNARTDWFDRRIGPPHQHQWSRLSCTRGFNLWGMTVFWGCGLREGYPGADAMLAQILSKLEPLDLDLPFHRELTHSDPDRRNAAASAASKFDMAWSKQDIWRWWEDQGWAWPARR